VGSRRPTTFDNQRRGAGCLLLGRSGPHSALCGMSAGEAEPDVSESAASSPLMNRSGSDRALFELASFVLLVFVLLQVFTPIPAFRGPRLRPKPRSAGWAAAANPLALSRRSAALSGMWAQGGRPEVTGSAAPYWLMILSGRALLQFSRRSYQLSPFCLAGRGLAAPALLNLMVRDRCCRGTLQRAEKVGGPSLDVVAREHLENCSVPVAPFGQRH
jgi:hypothetical protein